MGTSQSYPGLTGDLLEDYATLTYLSKGEILYLMKKFRAIDRDKIDADYHHRFHKEEILSKFSVLRSTETLYTIFHDQHGIHHVRVGGNACVCEDTDHIIMIELHVQVQDIDLLATFLYTKSHRKNNPFQDRLFRVFSSRRDNCFSFEDMIDLCSAMSADCPIEVKASWAFRIFDIDEDNQIAARDIGDILDRLTWDTSNPHAGLDKESKTKIADVILEEIKLDGSGSIGMNEFRILLTKIPEFKTSFYFRL